MDEVVISVDTSLFEQTLMMALISKSSDFNLIFNLTASKGLTRTTIFTFKLDAEVMQRSFTVVILDSETTTFQTPEMYEIASHKLFILRIKNVT